MENRSLTLNAILNLIKTICSVLFPLITFPYTSRILGVTNLGIYNFSFSIISYFTLIAGLGINTYAIREGSKIRDDRNKLSKFSSEVFTINFISMIISYVLLFASLFLFDKLRANYVVILVLSISILFTTLGCEWIYNIFEDFKFITIRSILFQIISLILLFLFVKTSDDLLIYALITVIASSGANIVNIITRKKYLNIKFRFSKNMWIHLTPILILFANSVATTVYINSDVTILGIISGDYYTGLYSVSTKVYTLVKTMIGSIIIVSIPRLSSYIGRNSIEEYQTNGNKIFNTILTFCIPAMIGVFCLSKEIILILSGEEFIKASLSLKILSFSLICSIISWFYTSCVLIPFKKEKIVLFATVSSAIINVVLNFILIPFANINAAAFTTMVAELTSALICFYYGKKYFILKIKYKNIISIFLGTCLIALTCSVVKTFFTSYISIVLISIIISVVLYFIVLMFLKNDAIKIVLDLVKKKP